MVQLLRPQRSTHRRLQDRIADASFLAAMRKREEDTWPTFHIGTKLQHYFFEVSGAGEIVRSH
jgi:hypothetical protein